MILMITIDRLIFSKNPLAYTAQGYENVLVADWGPVANLDYPTSRFAVKKVARVLAKLLEEFLQRHAEIRDYPQSIACILTLALALNLYVRVCVIFMENYLISR